MRDALSWRAHFWRIVRRRRSFFRGELLLIGSFFAPCRLVLVRGRSLVKSACGAREGRRGGRAVKWHGLARSQIHRELRCLQEERPRARRSTSAGGACASEVTGVTAVTVTFGERRQRTDQRLSAWGLTVQVPSRGGASLPTATGRTSWTGCLSSTRCSEDSSGAARRAPRPPQPRARCSTNSVAMSCSWWRQTPSLGPTIFLRLGMCVVPSAQFVRTTDSGARRQSASGPLWAALPS